MNVCRPCPSTDGNVFGHDPESLDFFELIRTPKDVRIMAGLWCPWTSRTCPMSLRNGHTAMRCNTAGKPLPFRLSPSFANDFKEHAARFGVKERR